MRQRSQIVMIAAAVAVVSCGGGTGNGRTSTAGPGDSGGSADEGSSGSGARSAEAAEIWGGAGGLGSGTSGSAGAAAILEPGELLVSVFQSTSCTTSTGANVAGLPELFTGRDPEEYFGLSCVAWRLDDSRQLMLDLVGFGVPPYGYEMNSPLWLGRARQSDDGALGVSIVFNFEYPMVVVPCPHNFSLAIEDVAASETLPLEINTRSCTLATECGAGSSYSLELPVGDTPEGIVCRYLFEANLTVYQDRDVLGTLHRPTEEGQCDEGLTPLDLETEAGAEWQICAPVCASETPECPLPDLLTCQQDVCQLATSW